MTYWHLLSFNYHGFLLIRDNYHVIMIICQNKGSNDVDLVIQVNPSATMKEKEHKSLFGQVGSHLCMHMLDLHMFVAHLKLPMAPTEVTSACKSPICAETYTSRSQGQWQFCNFCKTWIFGLERVFSARPTFLYFLKNENIDWNLKCDISSFVFCFIEFVSSLLY